MRYCMLLPKDHLCLSSTDEYSGNISGLSKLMGMLRVKELQRRLDEDGVPILVMGVHPGVVNSGASSIRTLV